MRKVLLGIAVILWGAIFSACGKEQDFVEADVQEIQELVIWSYFETTAQREGLDKLLRDFNQSQNEYRARWEYVPMTSFNKKLSSAYTENDLPDMAIIDNPDMPGLIHMGAFEDITGYMEKWEKEDFYPEILQTVEKDGSYFGVPLNCNSTALVYNKKMFEEKNLEVPTTLEEFCSVAKILTDEDRYGFMMCCIEGEQGTFQILPWIRAFGEDMANIGGEKTKEALKFLKNLVDDGSCPKDCINMTQTDLAQQFIEEKVAIIQNGPWIFPELDQAEIEYGIFSIPGEQNAVVGGENIGILKGKNKEGSIRFIEFLMGDKHLKEFCKKAGVLPAKKTMNETYTENMEIFVQQMDDAIARTSIKNWTSVSKALTDGMFHIISDEYDIEDIIKNIQQATKE